MNTREASLAELEVVLQLLPACTRCRRMKKRCDTRLPACSNCARGGSPCTFLDRLSDELLTREHIASLVERLKFLLANGHEPPDPASVRQASPSIVKHLFLESRETFRYLGGNATLAALSNNFPTYPRPLQPFSLIPPPSISYPCVDDAMHMFLITTYMNALHKAFPIIDLEQAGVQQLLVGQNRSSWDLFLLHMIDSIACHCLPSNDCRLLLLSDALLKAALVHFDKLAIHHNIETLQAVLLLAVRSLFDAQNGNIGQKIAFANRLEMELRGLDEEENGSVLRRLRAVMYCLYSRFSSPLDRSSDFLKVDLTNLSDDANDSEVLCGLYHIQSQVRNGESTEELNPALIEKLNSRVSSFVRATLRETLLLTKPSVDSAFQLLRFYARDDMILDAFSSHWAYGAGIFLAQHAKGEKRTQGYGMTSRILSRCEMKWPNAKHLQEALDSQALSEHASTMELASG